VTPLFCEERERLEEVLTRCTLDSYRAKALSELNPHDSVMKANLVSAFLRERDALRAYCDHFRQHGCKS
jgi:hypothetical protein